MLSQNDGTGVAEPAVKRQALASPNTSAAQSASQDGSGGPHIYKTPAPAL